MLIRRRETHWAAQVARLASARSIRVRAVLSVISSRAGWAGVYVAPLQGNRSSTPVRLPLSGVLLRFPCAHPFTPNNGPFLQGHERNGRTLRFSMGKARQFHTRFLMEVG